MLIQKNCRDDVRLAWEDGGFVAEEMDDELFIGREEVKSWRKVRRSNHVEVRCKLEVDRLEAGERLRHRSRIACLV
jgi:hypothetical protein